MAYPGTKGWYIKKLKEKGITKHPTERRKLECYKTYVVRNMYMELEEEGLSTSESQANIEE